MSVTARLDSTIRAVCPIDGVSVGTPGDPATVRIDYRPEATTQQRAAAVSALAAFDWSQAAQTAWEEDQKPERKSLRQQAAQAVADVDTYLVITSPNNAQVVAQVRRLSQYTRALIRRVIQLD